MHKVISSDFFFHFGSNFHRSIRTEYIEKEKYKLEQHIALFPLNSNRKKMKFKIKRRTVRVNLPLFDMMLKKRQSQNFVYVQISKAMSMEKKHFGGKRSGE